MKKIFFLFLLTFTFVPSAFASDTTVKNAGFIQTNIWYSKDTFYAGETVRIYTAIFNGTTNDLSGSVEFLDNNVLVGRTQFDLLGSGLVRDVSVPWKTTEGNHTVTARILNASTSLHGGQKTPITLENAEAGKSERVVEIDPAVKEALAKAEAERAAETGAQATGKVEGIVQTVSNAIPVPIKEGTAASVSAIESMRTALATLLRVTKENKGKDIDKINARANTTTTTTTQKAKAEPGIVSTISQSAEKPLAYIIFGILAFMQYFFEWKIVFYGVLLYALYRLLKWGIQKFRDR